MGLEDVDQRLARVAVGPEVGLLEDLLDLAAQQRDGARAAVIGRGGEQPEEAVLADHLAVRVEALDADVVHVARAVDGGAAVGLGQHQRFGVAGQRLNRGGQGREALRAFVAAVRAQDAQAGVGDRAQLVAAALAGQLVAPVAKQGEVIVVDPAQERRDLLQPVRVDGRRAAFELAHRLLEAAQDGAPVTHGKAHVLDHGGDVAADAFEVVLVALAVHLEVHPCLGAGALGLLHVGDLGDPVVLAAAHREHRVDDQVDGQPQAVQRHGHRIHQERHVRGDDLADRVGRLPAVLLRVRIVDADMDLLGGADLAQVPVAQRGAVEVVRAAVDHVLRCRPLEVLAHERLHQRRVLAAPALADAPGDGVDDFFPGFFFARLSHRTPCFPREPPLSGGGLLPV